MTEYYHEPEQLTPKEPRKLFGKLSRDDYDDNESEEYDNTNQPEAPQNPSGEVLTIKTRNGTEVHLGSYTQSIHELICYLKGMLEDEHISSFINSQDLNKSPPEYLK